MAGWLSLVRLDASAGGAEVVRLGLTTGGVDGEFRVFLFGAGGGGFLRVKGSSRVNLDRVLNGAGRLDVDGSTWVNVNDIRGKGNGGGGDHGDQESGSCAGNLGELHDDRDLFA